MKTIRTDLGAEGRLDILERVMSYRGGAEVGLDDFDDLLLNDQLCRLLTAGAPTDRT